MSIKKVIKNEDDEADVLYSLMDMYGVSGTELVDVFAGRMCHEGNTPTPYKVISGCTGLTLSDSNVSIVCGRCWRKHLAKLKIIDEKWEAAQEADYDELFDRQPREFTY